MLIVYRKDLPSFLLGLDVPTYDTHLLLIDIIEDRCLCEEFQYTTVINVLRPLVDSGKYVVLDTAGLLLVSDDFYIALKAVFNLVR